MKIKTIIARVLLGFVLISIGFALGRETERRSVKTNSGAGLATTQDASGDKVVVYYFFGSIRCTTCNKIESTAKKVVETQFAKELSEGRLEWKTENFQENVELAQRYNIASSSLVVARKQNGKDVKVENLEEVWTLVDDTPAFTSYVGKTVKSYLEETQ